MTTTLGQTCIAAIFSDSDGRRALPRRVRIDFDGNIDAAIKTANALGGRIAAQALIEHPRVIWYSTAYLPAEILADNAGIDHLHIGCWDNFQRGDSNGK
jgi:hypothetical protein